MRPENRSGSLEGGGCLVVIVLAVVAFLCFATIADAGIFRSGQRYIFNWRRPSVDAEPDQDNPQPIIDNVLTPLPSSDTKVIDDLVAENRKLKADSAVDEPNVAAAPDSKIPDWSLLAALGVGAGIPVIRRAASWIP